jgi:hypothetical protein
MEVRVTYQRCGREPTVVSAGARGGRAVVGGWESTYKCGCGYEYGRGAVPARGKRGEEVGGRR